MPKIKKIFFFLGRKWIVRSSFIRKLKKYNIVHVHGYMPECLYLIFVVKIILPSLVIIWTPHYHSHKNTSRPLLAWIYRFIAISYINKKSDYIWFLSKKEFKEMITKKISSKKILIIPSGHSYKNYQPKSFNKKYFAINIARNSLNKRLDWFVKLSNEIKTSKFCLITSSKLNIPKKSNLDIYINPVDEIKEKLIKKSSFFVQTSIYEAYGISAAECETIGVPAVINENSIYGNIKKNKQINWLKYSSKNFNSLLNVSKKLTLMKKNDYMKLSKQRIDYARGLSFENNFVYFLKKLKLIEKKYKL